MIEKDFYYYAMKAEETLAELLNVQTTEGKANCIAKAHVYALLAAGAPKTADETGNSEFSNA